MSLRVKTCEVLEKLLSEDLDKVSIYFETRHFTLKP